MPTPWPEWPDGFTTDPPELPGEVKFARYYIERNGRFILVAPLSREQAHAMHDDNQGYYFFVRLWRGELVCLQRGLPLSQYHPEAAPLTSGINDHCYLYVKGASRSIRAGFSETDEIREFRLDDLWVEEPEMKWQGRNRFSPTPQTIVTEYDINGVETKVRRLPIAEPELAASFGQPLAFGEYAGLLDLVNKYCRFLGYGDLIKGDAS